MFRSKTLFVLGAGAGDDFHFPTGASLMQDIKRKLTLDRSTAQLADSDIHGALLHHVNRTTRDSPHQYSLQDYLEAAEQISFGMPLSASIDTYMDDQRNDPTIQLSGRLAIVNSSECGQEGVLTGRRSSALGSGCGAMALRPAGRRIK